MRPDPRQGWRRFLPQLVALVVGLLAVLGVRLLLQDDDSDDGGGSRTTTTEAQASGERDPSSTTVATDADPDADAGADADDEGGDVDLGAVALRLDDLPAGWSAAEASPLELCPEADPARVVRPSDSYRVAYSGGASGPFVANVVAELPSADRAEDFLAAAEEAIEDCGRYEVEGTRFEVERIDGDDLGDESVAARVSGTSGGLPTTGPIYYVRVGRHVVTLAVVSVGDDDGEDVGREALEAVLDRL